MNAVPDNAPLRTSGLPAGGADEKDSWLSRFRFKPSFFPYLLAALLAILVAYPFVVLFIASFFTGQPGRLGEFTLSSYAVWFEAEGLGPIIVNSLIFATSRLGISLAFALLFAWAVARTNVPFGRAMSWMIPIPFFIPDLLTGISWLMLGNPRNGLINMFAKQWFGFQENVIDLYGWDGLLFHSSMSTISLMFLMLVGFFKAMDASYEEAAVTLGASRARTAFTITLPMMMPGILSVSILVFVSGLESFENPLLFGNPGGIYVFSNEIYRMLNFRHPPQYGSASALSVILLLITFGLLLLQKRALGSRSFSVVTGKGYKPIKLKLPRWARWAIFSVFVIYFLLAVLIPVTLIVVNSFFQVFGYYGWSLITLENWSNLFADSRAVNGFKNTVLYSTIAALATVVIGGLVGYVRVRTRHWLGPYLELAAWAPWTLPGIVMGLALLWAWALPPYPFNFYGTATVIVIGFVVKGLPLGTSTMQSSIHQISPELEESARVHGAGWTRAVWDILTPLLSRGAMAAFVIVFAMAARDLTIPLLLYSGGTETLTVTLLYYYQEGQTGTLAAAAVVQFALIMALLSLQGFFRRGSDD